MSRFLLFATLLLSFSTAYAQSTVPFVGCPSDGQVGFVRPPRGAVKTVQLSDQVAAHLSWYKAKYGSGVLGPRGWHCFSTYGSNGSSLFVTPQPLSSKDFFSEKGTSFSGPAIQLSEMVGDTSGRFSVAQDVARLFPAHRDFARRVRDEHLGLDVLPRGPAPTDQLRYLSKEEVEFTTPAHLDGEGTHTLLAKSDLPISGVVMLTGQELSCATLAIRLPPELSTLIQVITHRFEQDNPPTRSR